MGRVKLICCYAAEPDLDRVVRSVGRHIEIETPEAATATPAKALGQIRAISVQAFQRQSTIVSRDDVTWGQDALHRSGDGAVLSPRLTGKFVHKAKDRVDVLMMAWLAVCESLPITFIAEKDRCRFQSGDVRLGKPGKGEIKGVRISPRRAADFQRVCRRQHQLLPLQDSVPVEANETDF